MDAATSIPWVLMSGLRSTNVEERLLYLDGVSQGV